MFLRKHNLSHFNYCLKNVQQKIHKIRDTNEGEEIYINFFYLSQLLEGNYFTAF